MTLEEAMVKVCGQALVKEVAL